MSRFLPTTERVQRESFKKSMKATQLEKQKKDFTDFFKFFENLPLKTYDVDQLKNFVNYFPHLKEFKIFLNWSKEKYEQEGEHLVLDGILSTPELFAHYAAYAETYTRIFDNKKEERRIKNSLNINKKFFAFFFQEKKDLDFIKIKLENISDYDSFKIVVNTCENDRYRKMVWNMALHQKEIFQKVFRNTPIEVLEKDYPTYKNSVHFFSKKNQESKFFELTLSPFGIS